MLDLSAHVFYKAHLEINSKNPTMDIQRFIVMNIIRGWLIAKYRRSGGVDITGWNWDLLLMGGDETTAGVWIRASSYVPTKEDHLPYKKYWACKITEKHQKAGCASRTWITEIGLQQKTTDCCTFSYVVYYLNGTGYFGSTEERPESNIPNIIKSMLECQNITCYYGKTPINYCINYLDTGNGDKFSDFIKSPQRTVPIILLIADAMHTDDLGHPVACLSPLKLLQNVAGNALVYYARDPSFSEELSYQIDYSYWCRPGWVRVYYPCVNTDNYVSSMRNRYFKYDEVEQRTVNSTLEIFRRVFSQEIEYYNEQQMFRCENCEIIIQTSKNRMLRDAYRKKIAETKAAVADVEFYTEYIKNLESTNRRISEIEEELQKANEELRQTKGQYDYAREQLNECHTSIKNLQRVLSESQRYQTYPQDAISVANYYESVFGNKIAFTRRAKSSLQDCNTAIDILWDCLYHMATDLWQLYVNGSPNIEQSFHEKSGYDLARGEGMMTRSNKNLMRLRTDTYMGRKIMAEPHVKKGVRDNDPNSIRVYFAFDAETEKIVVSYCNGRHLENASSRSI